MPLSSNRARYWSLVLGLGILAGCAGRSAPLVPTAAGPSGVAVNPNTQTRSSAQRPMAQVPSARSWTTPAAKHGKNLVYVSDGAVNAVEIYPAGKTNPSPIGSITTGISTPDGITVTANGDLYVANANSSTVTVYRAGETSPYFTYSPGSNPVDVVVGSDKTVYIAQGLVGCICITEYAKGGSNPKLTVPLSGTGGSPLFMALDHLGNLYVSLTNGTVYEFAPGQTTGTNLGLSGLHNPRGLAFARKNALVVADDPLTFVNGYVDVYPPGQTQYTKQVAVGQQPFEVQFGKGKSQLYVANAGYSNNGSVYILDAGHKYKQTGTISQGLQQPLGVALSPGTK